MSRCDHDFDPSKLVCRKCGALGRWGGKGIVATRCVTVGCDGDAVSWFGPGDFRCDECKGKARQ